jgi:hypothetical protein
MAKFLVLDKKTRGRLEKEAKRQGLTVDELVAKIIEDRV